MININEVDDGGFEVKFNYSPAIVAAVKTIPGAYFVGQFKHWYIPAQSREHLFYWAKQMGLDTRTTNEPATYVIDPLPELQIDIPLKRTPFAFQRTGIAYALDRKRLIIGDQPGLGKTGQAIATAEGSGRQCILIICPATLKENWKIEIEQKWTSHKAVILSDKVKATWPTYYKVGMAKYFIVNYESLKKYFVQEIKVHLDKNGDKVPLRLNHVVFKDTINLFDMVIIDESHRCRDGKTQQTKFTMGITRGKEYILALTGTPVVNKPIDLLPQLFILGRGDDFGGYKGFVNRYCQGINQASNLKELNYLMHKNCFYRREKQDVLKDLPDKIRNVVSVDITNQSEYNKAETRLVDYLRDNLKKTEGEITTALRGETMVLIGILKKIAARGKIEAVLEYIREVTDAGEKMVTFAWHTEIVHALKEALPGAVTIVGSDSLDERNRAIQHFQECKKCRIKFENHDDQDHKFQASDVNNIICNIKSGGVGITLTAASRVSFIELPWHPADGDQCEDRCHRISQKDSVQANYFLGRGTIDEYIYKIIENKRGVANQVMGSEEEVQTNMVDEFINLFTTEKL